jgi:molybdate transport system substrate-binding protein
MITRLKGRTVMMTRMIGAAAAGLLLSSTAHAAEIKLLASAAIREAYLELIPEFEKTTGNKVVAQWAGTPDIQKRIAGGEAADLVILGSSGTDDLIRQGKLVPDSRANFVKSGIGVAVRDGAPKPDISSAGAVKAAVLAAKSVAYSAGASGAYIVTLFQRMGIADEVKAKTAAVKPGEPVGAVIARGDAELGFQQVAELVPVRGIQYVGPLPPEIQNITVFSGGVHSGAAEPEAAAALVKFLTAPAAIPIITKHNLEPG